MLWRLVLAPLLSWYVSLFTMMGKSSALYVEVRFSQLKCMDKAYADLEWLPKYSAFPKHERFCGHQPSILMIRPQLVSYQPPTWIFCDAIHHHYFYLLISVHKQTIGVMSIAMNITLTNVCLLHSIQKNPSTMADNERWSPCHHMCQLLLWEISGGWIMVIPGSPHCVCRGSAWWETNKN